MNDQEFAVEKARVKEAVETWTDVLGMHGWHIEICYEREYAECACDGGNFQTCFRVASDWRYQDADIVAYLPSTATVSDSRLDWMVVHELMHILVNEMRTTGDGYQDQVEAINHEERVVSTLATAVMRVREAGDCNSTLSTSAAADDQGRVQEAVHGRLPHDGRDDGPVGDCGPAVRLQRGIRKLHRLVR